ncbi:MAG: cysteine--tRNA ligase [Candidatus Helarchaeota archaeon]
MLKVFNTITGKKEEFTPFQPGVVRIYVCGPTVYDFSHVGHARSIISFDVIRRYLEWKGFRTIYIQNFTDIDDKMINRAKQEGITIYELAERFIKQYFEDFDALNVKRATFYPRATEHIEDMIRFIQKLIENEFAYVSEGNVYFSVEKFKNYGKLSHKKLNKREESQEGEAAGKKNANDFALWKRKKEGEPYWDSPWGQGRPGWHIECSTMSMKYLGESFDIHGGGLDLIFPHHENEIAQSEALTGKPFVRFFLHNGFVTVNGGEKMSKSLGNFFTIKEVLQKYEPMALRFFLISTHYRSPIDFNEDQIKQAEQTVKRFNLARAISRQGLSNMEISEELNSKLEAVIKKTRTGFIEAMDDDFATPRALASINDLVKFINNLASRKEGIDSKLLTKANDLLLELSYVLGLVKSPNVDENERLLDKLINILLQWRATARIEKKFDLADKIRNELQALCIKLLDYPNATIWIKDF